MNLRSAIWTFVILAACKNSDKHKSANLVKTIDSVSNVVDNLFREKRVINIGIHFSEEYENTSFVHYADSTLAGVDHIRKSGRNTADVITYYFQNAKLIKSTFAASSPGDSRKKGSYYFSQDGKCVFSNVDDKSVPSPEVVLDSANTYLLKQKK